MDIIIPLLLAVIAILVYFYYSPLIATKLLKIDVEKKVKTFIHLRILTLFFSFLILAILYGIVVGVLSNVEVNQQGLNIFRGIMSIIVLFFIVKKELKIEPNKAVGFVLIDVIISTIVYLFIIFSVS